MQNTPFMTMAMLQLQLLLLMAAGFVLTRKGTINASGQKALSNLLISFFLPCSIVCSYQIELNMEVLSATGLAFLLACAAQAMYYLAGRLLFRGQPPEKLACLRYATLCSNAGFLGLPIIGGVYGAMGSLLTSVALIPQRVVMWSAGFALFAHVDGKSVVKKVLTHPCIIAVYIGFALMFAGNPTLPAFLQKALSSAGGCTTPVSMLVIGSILAQAKNVNLKDKTVVWFSVVRLLIIPLAMLAAMRLLGVESTLLGVMVLISAMPAGSTTAILADKYNGDAPFASCMVFVSTIASMVTLPLLCLLL